MKEGEVKGHEIRANQFDRWVGEAQAEMILRTCEGTSLLDVGCGKGEFTKLYVDNFERVVGVEPLKKYFREADRSTGVEYIQGDGETFDLDENFDVIVLSMVIEHTSNPVTVLRNCKRHLAEDGIIIVFTPNANSITRRLGVSMGILDSIHHMTEREIVECGHKYIYTADSLERTAEDAGLEILTSFGFLYKPLPNEILGKICEEKGEEWRVNFIDALVELGMDHPEDCASLCIICM